MNLGGYDPARPMQDRIKAIYGASRTHFALTNCDLRDLMARNPAYKSVIEQDMALLQDIQDIAKNGYELTEPYDYRMEVIRTMAITEPKSFLVYVVEKVQHIRETLSDIPVVNKNLGHDIEVMKKHISQKKN